MLKNNTMRTPASENQDAIALLTKDQLWDMLAEAEKAPIELTVQRPLKDWPSDLLVWLFWSDEIQKLDPGCWAIEMIHAEMNARGEGERVAV